MSTVMEDTPAPAAAGLRRPVADWLAANGIQPGAVPRWAPIVVDVEAATVKLWLYVVDEDGLVQRERGHLAARRHTVPLVVPPDERVLARLRREADRRERRHADLLAVAARLRAAIVAEAEACEARLHPGDEVNLRFVRGIRHAARVIEHAELCSVGEGGRG